MKMLNVKILDFLGLLLVHNYSSRENFLRWSEIQLVSLSKDMLLSLPQVISSNICEFTCFCKINVDTLFH